MAQVVECLPRKHEVSKNTVLLGSKQNKIKFCLQNLFKPYINYEADSLISFYK
jgi:hypothetical protein